MKGLVTQFNTDMQPLGRKVLIMRHGQTTLNAQNKIRAWIDVPLDEVGISQARELGEAIRDSHIELDGIYSSDLMRSVQTSLEISCVTGIPLLGTTKALRPLDVGTLSGTDGEKAHAVIADHALHKPDEAIGGGESFNIFKYRMLSGIIGLLNSNRGLNLGFTSHSRGERLIHAWVAAGCPESLDIDLEVFLEHGEDTATAQELELTCPLVLS